MLPKKGKLDLVRKNTIEKTIRKRDETKKTIEPTNFHKRDEQFKKMSFSIKKNRKMNNRDSKKIENRNKHKQKKHKRVNKHEVSKQKNRKH